MTTLPPRAPASAPKDVEARASAPEPVAFPPDELKAACDDLLTRYPTRMAALIPILHLAQAHFGGWISAEVEAGVARYLELGDAHVRGVLTFYAMFNIKREVRHEVWVCRTLTCWLRGARDLRQAALDRAGLDETGEIDDDGRFLVKDMECLGLCEVAPAVFVDGQPHVNVTTDQLVELMDACE